MDVTIKIAGKAGQGTQTVGITLCRILLRQGCDVFADQDYMSRIRGGNNFFRVRIGDAGCSSIRENSDILVALDRESIALHERSLNANGVIVFDSEVGATVDADPRLFGVPLRSMARNVAGKPVFENSAACGVIAGILRLDVNAAGAAIQDTFREKGGEISRLNEAVLREGYRYGIERFTPDSFRISCKEANQAVLINGNDAIALAAVYAGCKFYSAYPMSPSTGVMTAIAGFAEKFGIVVEQAEDEIAAVNMVIGASFAGVRAMTATSGGGFALMSEGLSLAAMTETPLVIVNGQRPAPATGFPTRTEQADLDLVLHAGHGEFARAVFSPGTIEEVFCLTVKAFDIAEKYQVPVIILSDQYLADSYRNVIMPEMGAISRSRYLPDKTSLSIPYKRYALTESGVSPRAIPSGMDDVLYADSDEHTEEGHITEDGRMRIMMVQKRSAKKAALLARETIPPAASDLSEAEIILVGFGSTRGVVKEAVERFGGKRAGCIHLPQVWPFPSEKLIEMLKPAHKAKIMTMENNATGQLSRLLRRETGIVCQDSILKYDGRPWTVDEAARAIEQALMAQ
jgi:2-oxoglutarate ferredoxin oxidoreductase subunit alpha